MATIDLHTGRDKLWYFVYGLTLYGRNQGQSLCGIDFWEAIMKNVFWAVFVKSNYNINTLLKILDVFLNLHIGKDKSWLFWYVLILQGPIYKHILYSLVFWDDNNF